MMSARVYEHDLRDVEVAISLYRRVLEIDAFNLPAAESLERLFRTTERYADLSLVLQKKSEISELKDVHPRDGGISSPEWKTFIFKLWEFLEIVKNVDFF